MKTFLRWPVLFVLAALLVAALVPTILTINHTPKAHASGGATLSLSAPIGQPGTTIQATGQGFTPSLTVSLYLGSTTGTLLATATSDSSGNLPSTNITVPDQPGGYYGIVAEQGSMTASAQFSIVPSISLSKTALYPNASIVVTVKGFGASDSVFLYLDNTNSYYFSNFGVNQYGDATVTTHFQNQGVLQGTHTIIATNGGGWNPLSTQIAVTVKPTIFSTAVKSGMNMQLNGAGFTANEPVSIYWGNAQGQLEGTTTTDAYGNLSFSFTVPSGLSSGSYLITVLRTNQSPHNISSLFNIITPVFTSTPGIRNGQNIKVKIAGFLPNEQVI